MLLALDEHESDQHLLNRFFGSKEFLNDSQISDFVQHEAILNLLTVIQVLPVLFLVHFLSLNYSNCQYGQVNKAIAHSNLNSVAMSLHHEGQRFDSEI